MRETRVPVTAKSILIPPVAMSTGAFLLGAFVFSWPLTHTSRLEARDGHVYMKRSP